MKKEIYLVVIYDKKTEEYKGTIYRAFETHELAKGYAAACNNGKYKFALVKVPFITCFGEI